MNLLFQLAKVQDFITQWKSFPIFMFNWSFNLKLNFYPKYFHYFIPNFILLNLKIHYSLKLILIYFHSHLFKLNFKLSLHSSYLKEYYFLFIILMLLHQIINSNSLYFPKLIPLQCFHYQYYLLIYFIILLFINFFILINFLVFINFLIFINLLVFINPLLPMPN